MDNFANYCWNIGILIDGLVSVSKSATFVSNLCTNSIFLLGLKGNLVKAGFFLLVMQIATILA